VLVVAEVFGPTFQGEGPSAGRRAMFLRLGRCNLDCTWCDTPYTWDWSRFDPAIELHQRSVEDVMGELDGIGADLLVITGGEPMLQQRNLPPIVSGAHARGWRVEVETNGTIAPPAGLDWVCVSPKADAELKLMHGDELKLIYPQQRAEPEKYAGLEFKNFFLQPLDDAAREENTLAATDYCLKHPQWRLSLQTHKLLGIR